MNTELTIGAINPGYGGLPIGVAAALGTAPPVARRGRVGTAVVGHRDSGAVDARRRPEQVTHRLEHEPVAVGHGEVLAVAPGEDIIDLPITHKVIEEAIAG